MKKWLMYMVCVFTFVACKKDQFEQDETLIKQYISDNKLIASRTSEGLYYAISDTGSGVQPSIGNSVKINYVGYLTNGKVFDSSPEGNPPTFALANLIAGWQIGLPLIKEGGRIKLLVPSALGYGGNKSGPIPANSVLVFDIELLSVI